MGGSVM